MQLDGTHKITDTAMAEVFFYYGVDFEAGFAEPFLGCWFIPPTGYC